MEGREVRDFGTFKHTFRGIGMIFGHLSNFPPEAIKFESHGFPPWTPQLFWRIPGQDFWTVKQSDNFAEHLSNLMEIPDPSIPHGDVLVFTLWVPTTIALRAPLALRV